jgi:transposase-like protein
MVAAVRRGASMRSVARRFGVALATVQFWRRRAGRRRLGAVDWDDRPGGCRSPANRTPGELEELVLTLRRELRDMSVLGECGAVAIRAALRERRPEASPPSVRTIGRILERRGALDGNRRVRRPPPPKGWYLPAVAAGTAELDSFDAVEGLVIRGGTDVEVFNGISLHGGLVLSVPTRGVTAVGAVQMLIAHWREVGLPDFAQFDNDTRFQGAHQWPDAFGRVTRLCLQLGVAPVFVPPRETGFQAAIESYNGRWQAKVWSRFEHESLRELRRRSMLYTDALRRRAAPRIESAPPRRRFPADWRFDLGRPLAGKVLFLRRTDAHGRVSALGRTFEVDRRWMHRLVRCEFELDAGTARFFALRRRDPAVQPLLSEQPYAPPKRRFKE